MTTLRCHVEPWKGAEIASRFPLHSHDVPHIISEQLVRLLRVCSPSTHSILRVALSSRWFVLCLKTCPNLTDVEMPTIYSSNVMEALSYILKEHPRLRSFRSFSYPILLPLPVSTTKRAVAPEMDPLQAEVPDWRPAMANSVISVIKSVKVCFALLSF
jgi:hypothetical protein